MMILTCSQVVKLYIVGTQVIHAVHFVSQYVKIVFCTSNTKRDT